LSRNDVVLDHAPLCQAPDPTLRQPSWILPLGAIDTHAHICGPANLFPYWEGRIYTPPDALLSTYLALLANLGVSRAVLVQPSVYGTDNRALLTALAADPVNLRGVAVVDWNVPDNELERLHLAGVRGLRCNIVDLASAKGELPKTQLMTLAKRIAPLGWHLEFLMHANEFPDLASLLGDLPVPIVLGHFGYVNARQSMLDKGFQSLLSMVREGRAWVKFTGQYRISAHSYDPSQPLYPDVRPFADALIAANPKQLLWGTDWPHVMVKGAMPNDADLLNLCGDWVQDTALREQIWLNNPMRLYGF
jgi:2-pyrone-4,6-dicarboxylate lactonase